MKLTHKDIDKNSSGSITLIPEEAEDMWHTYNLVSVGDTIRSTTIRKVQTETATGSVNVNKVRTTLTIQVESIDFDTQACVLRVSGRNIRENQYVKMGAYHTLLLEMNRQFTLTKQEWDSVATDRIETACDPVQHADLMAIIMQEGVAHICLVTPSMTLVRAKIETNIPRKRKGMCDQHTKGLQRFYDQIIQAFQRHMNFDIVKCVLVASPGFVKDHFVDYLFSQAQKMDDKTLLDNRSKFVLVHSSSGFKHSLKALQLTIIDNDMMMVAWLLFESLLMDRSRVRTRVKGGQVPEVLADPAIAGKLADTKAAGEVKALEDFYTMLQTDPDRAYYGMGHCEKAAAQQAIEVLLISDELFRAQNVAQRKRYVSLVDSVKENGGDVKIFSSLHVSGEQLGQLSGVAAILRFPMPDDGEDQDDDSDED